MEAPRWEGRNTPVAEGNGIHQPHLPLFPASCTPNSHPRSLAFGLVRPWSDHPTMCPVFLLFFFPPSSPEARTPLRITVWFTPSNGWGLPTCLSFKLRIFYISNKHILQILYLWWKQILPQMVRNPLNNRALINYQKSIEQLSP